MAPFPHQSNKRVDFMPFMGDLCVSHGAFPHQADELMRPRLSRHPQEDVSERVLGEPAVLDLVTARPVVSLLFWIRAKNLSDSDKSHYNVEKQQLHGFCEERLWNKKENG